jgi:hypothetical protein
LRARFENRVEFHRGIVSILVVVVLVAQFPTAYRFQAGFNRRIRALREIKQSEQRKIDPHGYGGASQNRPVRGQK